MTLREEVESALPGLRSKCERVVAAYGSGEELAGALGGLYFAFKGVKFVAHRHDELMADPEKVNRGNGDEAGYFAENMVRTVHSTGDLLATALVACGQAERPTGYLYLSKLKQGSMDPGLWTRIDDLQKPPAWDYVAAFSNMTKHNAFIDRTSVSTDGVQEVLFYAFDHRDSPYAERRFGEVLGYCLELLRREEKVLDWLLENAPVEQSATVLPAGLEYASPSLTASFTPPSVASFTRRTLSTPKDEDPA